jgi:hypothetical protein
MSLPVSGSVTALSAANTWAGVNAWADEVMASKKVDINSV